jgi:hypothetical protein
MTIKVVTSFRVLMNKAMALGKAKLSHNQTAIEQAQKEHDEYLKLCKDYEIKT